MKEGSCFLMADIGHFVCTFSNPRNADRIKGQSLLIGSSAAQNAAILDPAKFVREIGFVVRATFSVS